METIGIFYFIFLVLCVVISLVWLFFPFYALSRMSKIHDEAIQTNYQLKNILELLEKFQPKEQQTGDLSEQAFETYQKNISNKN